MRTLPHNDEAEKAILGALLMREDAYDIVSEIIGTDDFYQPMNGVIFSAIEKMKGLSNQAVDIITLIDHLRKDGSLDKAGGAAYIAGLTEAVSVTANVEQYAHIVKEMSIRRTLVSLSSSFTEKAFDETEDIEKTLDSGQNEMLQLSLSSESRKEDYTIRTAVSSVVNTLIKRMSGEMEDVSIPTGFDILDFKVQYGLKSYDQYDDEHFFYAGIDFNVVEHLVLDIYGGAYDLSHADESWYLGGNVGYEVSGVTFKLGLEYGAGASYAYDDNYWNDGEQSGKGLWIVPSISVKF